MWRAQTLRRATWRPCPALLLLFRSARTSVRAAFP